MTFDPTQYGAVPVSTPSSTFDPLKFGAVPVQSQTDANVPPLDSFGTMLQKSLSGTISGAKQFGTGFMQAGQGFLQGDSDLENRGKLNLVAGGINTVYSPVANVLNRIGAIPVGGGDTIGGRIQKNGIQDIVDRLGIADSPTLQSAMLNNPHADEVVGNLITIGMALAGGANHTDIQEALNGNNTEGGSTPANPPPPPPPGTNGAIQSTVDTIKNEIPSTGTDENMQAIASHINDQLGITGKKLVQLNARGIDPGQVIAEQTGAPIPETINSNGVKVLDTETLNNTLDENKSPAYSIIDQGIKQSGNPSVPFNLEADAARIIDNTPSEFMSDEAKLAAKKELPAINQTTVEARSPRISTGDDGSQTIPLQDVQEIKQNSAREGRFDIKSQTSNAYRDAQKAYAAAAKQVVENNLKDINVKNINKEVGAIEEVQKILESKTGIRSKAQPGFVAKLAREGIAGLAAFPFGKIPALISGALINPVLDWVTSLPIEMRSSMLQEAIASGDTRFANILKEGEAGVNLIKNRIQSRLALPPASYIEGQAPIDTSGIKVVPAQKSLPVRDPITGRMKTNYSSTIK